MQRNTWCDRKFKCDTELFHLFLNENNFMLESKMHPYYYSAIYYNSLIYNNWCSLVANL